MTATERRALARGEGVNERSVRNWMQVAREAEEGVERRSPGRPAYGHEERRRARVVVLKALRTVGWSVGEPTLVRMLGARVPRTLLRQSLAALKAQHRREVRERRKRRRTSVRVLSRDAMWSMDASHVGRDLEHRSVQVESIRDVASSHTLDATIGSPPTGNAIVAQLERVCALHAGAPLVLATDGGECDCDEVRAWLQARHIVHLRSLPHTPEHNPWIERGFGELKAETGLGKGVVIDDLRVAGTLVVGALARLDYLRPRASRGWKTAAQCHRELRPARNVVDRDRFYFAACCAIRRAVLHSKNKRARRRAERAAILNVMESYGPIQRTRGGEPIPKCDSEVVS